jgi:predicted Zn-dependent protease
VAAQHVGRLVGWSIGCVAAPLVLGSMFGPAWIAVGMSCAALATLWLALWLPRSAHAAFEGARFDRAARRYRLIALMSFSPTRERAALLSRAGCEVGAGRLPRAEALLAALDPVGLDTSERVVWLNNRASASLDAGGDPHAALELVDEAIALRPDVPAVQHTRGKALLAVGRVDDAIAVLDAMRAGGELSPHLEAARCADLARAWEAKGQAAYADDYRERARLVAR